MRAEATFDAMGSTAHLLVVGPDADTNLAWARTRLSQLETRWTRFSPDSEVSRLNENGGHPMIVTADTYRLIDHAVTAWGRTNGRYDPTLLHALTGLGYDVSDRYLLANEFHAYLLQQPPVEVSWYYGVRGADRLKRWYPAEAQWVDVYLASSPGVFRRQAEALGDLLHRLTGLYGGDVASLAERP